MNLFKAIQAVLRGQRVTLKANGEQRDLAKHEAKGLAMRGEGRAYKRTFKGVCGAMTWREIGAQ